MHNSRKGNQKQHLTGFTVLDLSTPYAAQSTRHIQTTILRRQKYIFILLNLIK